MEQTRKEAYEDGFKIGYAEGVEIAKRQIGLKMKEHNLDIEYIADITGLSIEAVQKL